MRLRAVHRSGDDEASRSADPNLRSGHRNAGDSKTTHLVLTDNILASCQFITHTGGYAEVVEHFQRKGIHSVNVGGASAAAKER